MKTIVSIAAILLSLMAACNPDKLVIVSGQLEGIASDTLLATYYPVGNRDAKKRDTIPMQQGNFSFAIPADSAAFEVVIQAKPSSIPDADGRIAAFSMQAARFVVLPGEPLNVNGSLSDYKVEGGDYYADYNRLQELCRPYYDQMDSLQQRCMALGQQPGVTPDSVRAVYEAEGIPLRQKIAGIYMEYICKHPQKHLSVMLAASLPEENLDEAAGVLGAMGENSLLAPMLQDRLRYEAKKKQREEAEKVVSKGAVAPDFTLSDIDGKPFTLSSLKGKYVVLDFWGSWCGWCIKGIPEMKKSYAKYRTKLEIVGIACNDTEEAWKKAVKKHELPWTNVRNEEDNDVAVRYAVGGFPTKYVIDPEGKIVDKVIGEDPAFYELLDRLLGSGNK